MRHRHIVMHGVQPRILQPLEDFFFVFVHGKGWFNGCLNKDNENTLIPPNFPSKKNAPFRGKF